MRQKYNLKRWMTGLLAVILTLGMGLNAQAQTEVFNETLRSGSIPAGWSQVDVTFATAAGGYANFTSLSATLTTPAFNGSAFGSVEVAFAVAKFGSGVDGPITVEYSINGGEDWVKAGDSSTPTSSTYIVDTITINSVSSTMLIRFTRPDSPSAKRLRDVVITGLAPVGTPILNANPTSITGLNYIDGSGPSSSQSIEITGINLDGTDVVLTAPANFEIAETIDGTYGETITFTAYDGTAETIFVRLESGLAVGPYSGNITSTGGDATSLSISLSGEVEEVPPPTLSSSTGSLSGFSYEVDNGPSGAQSFTLTGASLDGTDVTITAPANFEVSEEEASGFSSSVTLTAYDGSSTTIYARMASGLAIGTYSGDVTIAGGGAADIDVSLSGSVSGPPPAVAVLDADGYEENFAGFQGAGFSAAPVAGQLNSANWRLTGMSDGEGTFDGNHTTGDFARGLSNGGTISGGTYAFNAGDGITVLGVQPTGADFTPGTITLRLENASGDIVDNISVSYDIYVYNDQGRSSSFNFAFSTDDVTYTPVNALDYTTPEAADSPVSWVRVERSTILTGLGLADGEFIYLQWQSNDVGGGGSRDEFGLTNVSASVFTGAVISGSAGWRILSDPTTATLSQFLDPIWTQGLPGSDYPTGDNNPEANVITINTLTGAYQALPTLAQSSPAGSGFGVYVYDEDVYGDASSSIWPKLLPTSDVEYASPVVVIDFMGLPLLGANPNSFALVGNPFLSDISWDVIVADGGLVGLQNAVYLQDHTVGAEGDWISYVGGVGDLPAGGIIATYQGFAVQSSADVEARSLTFTDNAKSTGGTLLSAPEFDALVNLKLNYEDKSVSNWIRISETGSMVRSNNDAVRLSPLSSNYMLLATEKLDGSVLSIGDFPSHEQSLQIPLHVESTIGGTYSITTADFNVNPNWTLKLQDTLTGQIVDLTSGFEYTFELEAINTTASDVSITEKSLAPVILENDSPRFIVIANAVTTSAPVNNELPTVLALNQNYPNPFNPTTQISYDLPENAEVRLDVFNIQGQRVATLVNTTQNAGTHRVNFNGANLSSGVYIYRLTAGTNVLTKKMTLIK